MSRYHIIGVQNLTIYAPDGDTVWTSLAVLGDPAGHPCGRLRYPDGVIITLDAAAMKSFCECYGLDLAHLPPAGSMIYTNGSKPDSLSRVPATKAASAIAGE